MTEKEKAVIRLVVWVVIGVAYIQASAFMARYYTTSTFKIGKNSSTINRILLEPIKKVTEVISQQEPVTNNYVKNHRLDFFVYFFAWPFFVICALLYWGMLLIILLLILASTVVALLLSYVLNVLIFIITSYKIF